MVIFADGNGGNNVCNPRIANCTFINNGAAEGAAIFNFNNATPFITNCLT
ncbi:MAG: hypothetical protein AAGG68_16035 [Bacteroidota bacterium]